MWSSLVFTVVFIVVHCLFYHLRWSKTLVRSWIYEKNQSKYAAIAHVQSISFMCMGRWVPFKTGEQNFIYFIYFIYITLLCNIFPFFSNKTEINQTIKYHQKFIMWQFSMQGRKFKGWNWSCFPSIINPINCINYWFVILYYPESINACEKPTLIIICLN